MAQKLVVKSVEVICKAQVWYGFDKEPDETTLLKEAEVKVWAQEMLKQHPKLCQVG